jgi:hypothetical protein
MTLSGVACHQVRSGVVSGAFREASASLRQAPANQPKQGVSLCVDIRVLKHPSYAHCSREMR